MRAASQPAFEIGVLLGDVLAADLHALEFAHVADIAAQVEDEGIEMLGGCANGDGAAHFAVGQLFAVDRGDEGAVQASDDFRDGGNGGVERGDFELDIAATDDDARGGSTFGGLVGFRCAGRSSFNPMVPLLKGLRDASALAVGHLLCSGPPLCETFIGASSIFSTSALCWDGLKP